MEIISHRGYWQKESEKNSIIAFKRSFALGFGTETDIRDYKGELVISHDIADAKAIKLEHFFDIYKSFNNNLPLALNIKADGLQLNLKEIIKKYEIENYFVFDMSIPDTLSYLKHEFRVFTRHSEYELKPAFYDISTGVWLDEFHSHWIDESVLIEHIKNQKKICIVSPDLHKRDYQREWSDYREFEKRTGCFNMILCTDFPEKAREFLNE